MLKSNLFVVLIGKNKEDLEEKYLNILELFKAHPTTLEYNTGDRLIATLNLNVKTLKLQ